MKATVLAAAAALVCGTAAFAQQQDNTPRTDYSTRAETAKPADDAHPNALQRMGDKVRHALHRTGDKVHHTAKNEKDRHEEHHARAEDRHGDNDRDRARHARADRDDDTRAMGAPGSSMRDTDMSRRQRMDDAYSNWKARQKNG